MTENDRKPMSMRVYFSKSLTYPAKCNNSMLSNIVSMYDEREMLAYCGRKSRYIRADTKVCFSLLKNILFNYSKYDAFITGRYGDIFAILKGMIFFLNKPLVLLDVEWPNKRKKRILKYISMILHKLVARGSMKMQVFCESEIDEYSAYYGIDRSKFLWIPYCTDEYGEDWVTQPEEDYIFTGGHQQRDWETLYNAVKDLPISVYVVAPNEAIESRYISENMKLLGTVHKNEYFRIMSRSKLVVLSLQPNIMRSPGVITYVYAMRMGKCVIVNDISGAKSYIENQRTGIIVEPKNADVLKKEIVALLNDDNARNMIGSSARDYALGNLSGRRYISDINNIVDKYVK